MPDAGYRMPDAGYRMRDTGCGILDASCGGSAQRMEHSIKGKKVHPCFSLPASWLPNLPASGFGCGLRGERLKARFALGALRLRSVPAELEAFLPQAQRS